MEEEQKRLEHPPMFDSSFHPPSKIDEKQRDAKTYGDHLTPFKERNILEESPSEGKNAFKSTGHRDDNSTLRLQAAKDQHNMFVGEPIVCASHNDVVDPSMPVYNYYLYFFFFFFLLLLCFFSLFFLVIIIFLIYFRNLN